MATLRALGLMSGTSMDGVDAAVVETDGERIAGFGASRFLPYSADEQALIRRGLGLWPDGDPALLGEIAALVEARHAEAVGGFGAVDVVGFHGQTLAHDPARARTHQVGRGEALAAATGRTVVWDFRGADMASGGEGAPLAPFFHFAGAGWIGAAAPVAFLNLGGVGNLTWVDPRAAAPEQPGALVAFDTGPGNALINDFIGMRLGAAFDSEGSIAAGGRVHPELIADIGEHPYIRRAPPKSLDRNEFGAYLHRVAGLSTEDGAATLAALTAACVAEAGRHFPEPPERWLVCGGGRRNATVMRMLRAATNRPVEPVEAAGLDGDMLEAQAFAYLAVRVLRGLPTSAPSTTGCRLPVSGGRVARPEMAAG